MGEEIWGFIYKPKCNGNSLEPTRINLAKSPSNRGYKSELDKMDWNINPATKFLTYNFFFLPDGHTGKMVAENL